MELTITPLNEEKLYETRTFNDGIAGSLVLRIPTNFDGFEVLSRKREYIGHTQIYTPNGPIGVQFNLPGCTCLRDAFDAWPAAARSACEKIINDLQSQAIRASILAPGKKPQ